MTTPELIELILKIVGAIVTTIGTLAAIAYAIFQWFGTRWLDKQFTQKIEAYKHELNQQLETHKSKLNKDLEDYKYQINALFNRVTRAFF